MTHATIRATFAFITPQYGRLRSLGNGSVKNGIGYARATLHDTVVVNYQTHLRDYLDSSVVQNVLEVRHGGFRTRTTKAWIESALTGLLSNGRTAAAADRVTVTWPGKYKAEDGGPRTYQGDDEITITRFHGWGDDSWQTESVTLKPGESGVLHGHDGTPYTVHYKGE